MLRHKSTAAIFPLALVLAVGVERVATSLLGTFPGEPVVWMISGEFRRMLRPISELLTTLSGGSLTLQAVLIAACTFAIWMALTTRIGRPASSRRRGVAS